MEKILLCNSLIALKAFGQAVRIIFKHSLHPNINGEAFKKAEAEKKSAVRNLPARK